MVKFTTVREKIFWSYANLAMAHTAVKENKTTYDRTHFMIRAKLFKGLKTGTMNIRSIFDDEKIKLNTGKKCNYCGSSEHLALDHIFPKKLGGEDTAENLIYACRSCNSSKGKKDLMEWMSLRDEYLPLMVIRRYLKLTYRYCSSRDLLDERIEDIINIDLPFNISYLPTQFPNPQKLVISIENKEIPNA
jgi:DNA-directed RNA polymerase subunit RPC12/RpoP